MIIAMRARTHIHITIYDMQPCAMHVGLIDKHLEEREVSVSVCDCVVDGAGVRVDGGASTFNY